jgi:hypothetical protein
MRRTGPWCTEGSQGVNQCNRLEGRQKPKRNLMAKVQLLEMLGTLRTLRLQRLKLMCTQKTGAVKIHEESSNVKVQQVTRTFSQ